MLGDYKVHTGTEEPLNVGFFVEIGVFFCQFSEICGFSPVSVGCSSQNLELLPRKVKEECRRKVHMQ